MFPEMKLVLSIVRLFTHSSITQYRMVNYISKVVEDRKKNLKANESTRDMLQLLLEQQADTDQNKENRKLSNSVIVANAFMFLMGGYETSSTSLSFAAWLLAKYPEVQKKLQKEIDQKLTEGDLVNYELVNKMPYLDAVFRETNRVFSIAGFSERRCVKECDIGPLHFVPGVLVHMPVKRIHNDPDIWPNPENFEPERFLNSNYPSVAWLPFGIGPRNCLGMRFADMEYKMLFVRLLSQYNLEFGAESSMDELPTRDVGGILRPMNGVFVKITRRKQPVVD